MAKEQYEDKDKKNYGLYVDAQRKLISALLYDSADAGRVFQLLTPEDFEEPRYEKIFYAALELSRKNETISAVSVGYELERNGELEQIGGPQELYHMRAEGSMSLLEAPIQTYAQVVKEAAAKFKIRRSLTMKAEMFKIDSGLQAQDGISELQSELNEELYKLSDDSTSVELTETFSEYRDLLSQRLELTEQNKDVGEGLQGIPCLLPGINKLTGGWLPGQMITIGARTGVGKSIFAVNCAIAAAQANKSVLFFSLEMNEFELQDRIVAAVTGVSLNKLKKGTLEEQDFEAVEEHGAMIGSMKIKIETEAKITVDSMRAKALEMAQSANGLDFIILDYLQLVTATGRTSSRQEALADISRNIKLLAKQLDVPIMVLVQVNREKDDDENPVPKMSQIRESGAIAQDSDIVILLHREESMDDTIPHTLVILEKNRQGKAQVTVRCYSNLENSLFREVNRAPKEGPTMSDEDEQEAFNSDELDDILADVDDIDDDELF